MTAEVAIMNTQGIALAAGSAVTLSIGKTYNSADRPCLRGGNCRWRKQN
jgi:hypothetical protein